MKRQSEERLNQLMSQYKAVMSHLNAVFDMNAAPLQAQDRIHIKVERADSNLLMYQPRLVDGESRVRHDSEHPGMVASVHEIISAVDANHYLRGTIGNWTPRSTEPTLDRVKSLLEKVEPVAYLLRTVVYNWYREIGLTLHRGEPVRREFHVYIYRAPREGFDNLLASTDVTRTVRLRMEDTWESSGPIYGEVRTDLRRLVDLFGKRAYLCGLRQALKARWNKSDGSPSTIFGVTMVGYSEFTGTEITTLSRGDDEITFGFEVRGDVCVRLGSINATLPTARAMVEEVVSEWERMLHQNRLPIAPART